MQANNREIVVQELEAYQSLVQHPGWELLAKRIRATAEESLRQMKGAQSQDMLLKHTYTYMAQLDMLESPAMLIRVLAQQLQTTKK